MAGYQWSYY